MERNFINNSSDYNAEVKLQLSFSPPGKQSPVKGDSNMTLGELLISQPKDPPSIKRQEGMDIFQRLSFDQVSRERKTAMRTDSGATTPELTQKRFVDRGTSPMNVISLGTTITPTIQPPKAKSAIQLSTTGQQRRDKLKSKFVNCVKNPDPEIVVPSFRRKAFAKGTVYRQDMIVALVEEANLQDGTEIMNALCQTYSNPSSRLTMAATLQGQMKSLIKDKGWQEGMRATLIEKGQHVPKRFPPLTAKLTVTRLSSAPETDSIAATILLMWITNSRHADLAKFIIQATTTIQGTTFLFCTVYGVKSDVMNKKNFLQAFAVPEKFRNTIFNMLPQAGTDGKVKILPTVEKASLLQVQTRLKEIKDSLVSTSVRIGSSQTLRSLGLSMQEIAASTFHGLERDTGSLSTYLKGCWWVDETLNTQIFNSLVLMRQSELISQEALDSLKTSDLKDIFLKRSQLSME